MTTTAILLATYNGAPFLGPQLQSLRHQSHQDLLVFSMDDGSKDKTLEILKTYSTRDSRFQRPLVSQNQQQGPLKTFLDLLEEAFKNPKIQYFFFCDQDDIWESHKIKIQVETFLSDKIPQGVFSDLLLMDQKSKVIASSMHSQLGFYSQSQLWPGLLVQNIVTGCTLGFNREAAKVILDSKSWALKGGLMHDHWSSLIIAKYGILRYCPQKLVAYRQHTQNASGGVKSATILSKIKFLLQIQDGQNGLEKRILGIWKQIEALRSFSEKASKNLVGLEIPGKPTGTFGQVIMALLENSIKAEGWLRTLIFWFGTMFLKKKIGQQALEWHHEFSELASTQKRPVIELSSQMNEKAHNP
jgi:rhamnosyltransferase